MTTTYLNDVDLPTVGALVQSIQEDPDRGRTTWKSEVTWGGAFRTTARSRDLAPVAFDEPPGLGGTNTAPNPVEQLLGPSAPASSSVTPRTPVLPASS